MKPCARHLLGGLALALTVAGPSAAQASEGGVSLWIPGQSVPAGGILPPQGVYFDSTTWFYNATFARGGSTVLGGNVVANVRANTVADFVTGLWVTPVEILGGDLAVAVVVPFGEPTVRAGILIDGPLVNRALGRPLALGARDATFNAGDPIVSTSLGWHSGNWNWKLSAAVSIPAGAYEPGQLSNVALNRVVGDFSAGASYVDAVSGIELSAVAGFAVNGENPSTRYVTGDEFHFDASVSKYLTKELSVGAIVSHYQQITGDSGPGARLGPFKGRVTAVGGTLGMTVPVGQIPVSARFKVLRDVEVENRFQGTTGYFEVSFPLWVAPPKAAPEAVASVRKS
ncbi:UNVERIFIED_CONTAM: transporter [Methylobacteriaceae bacterium AG10]|nr:transporter [Methylobacteriaceae bacterium AG10]